MARYSEKRRAALEATLKEEVLAVSTAILRKEGFAALTMDRIARDVGVSRGTLYNYFTDADAVLVFVEKWTFDPIRTEIEAIATSDRPPAAKLEAITCSIFDALCEDRALALALFAKKELRGPRAEQKIRHRDGLLRLVEGIVTDGVEAGRLRRVPTHLVAEVFLGVIGGFIESMLYSGEFSRGEEIAPAIMDVILHGLEPRGPEADTSTDSPEA